MKAIVLAAGQGKRLLPLTENLPKSLLKVGDQTIIEHILDRLVKCDINETLIVVGHEEKKIKQKIGKIYKGMKINYISNPIYHKTNNIYSLWLAKETAKDGFVLINGDDIFNVRILDNIIRCVHKDAGVIDDSVTDLPEEAMKVTIHQGIIKEVSKKVPKEKIHGDAIGIYKFSTEGSKKFFEEIEKFISRDETNVFYLHAMTNLAKAHDIHAISTKNMSWFEIDDHNDLEKAQDIIKKIEEEENSV